MCHPQHQGCGDSYVSPFSFIAGYRLTTPITLQDSPLRRNPWPCKGWEVIRFSTLVYLAGPAPPSFLRNFFNNTTHTPSCLPLWRAIYALSGALPASPNPSPTPFNATTCVPSCLPRCADGGAGEFGEERVNREDGERGGGYLGGVCVDGVDKSMTTWPPPWEWTRACIPATVARASS